MPLVVPVLGESYCRCPTQTEVTHDPATGAPLLDCGCGEEDQTCDWVWDEACKSSSTYLSCSDRKVSFHMEYSCGTAAIRGNQELADGQHFWEIKMTSPVYGTDMMVGVGTSEVNLDQFRHSFCSLLGTDGDSWGLSYTGLLHHKGAKVTFSPRFGQGSIIGVHLDNWHGTLTFYKNRRCIGVAARQLQNKRLYPMVCSTAAKSSMKMIRSCSVPTSLQYLCCDRLRQHMPPNVDVLSVLPLPPGLRRLLRSRLGWVLSLNQSSSASDTDSDTDEHAEDSECCSSSDSEYVDALESPSVDLVETRTPVALQEIRVDLLEPRVNLLEGRVDLQDVRVDILEPRVDLLEGRPRVDLRESMVDLRGSRLDLRESRVDLRELRMDLRSSAADVHVPALGAAAAASLPPLLCPSCLPSFPLLPDFSGGHQSEAATSDSDTDSCASDPETCQRKRCRWT
ncbi:SPRY domain-containing SOCS box protein 3 isoform X2 [Engraulis encrasicolus]